MYLLQLGSVAANALMFAPTTKNLFQRAILSSGCWLNPWSHTDTQSHVEIIKYFGKGKIKFVPNRDHWTTYASRFVQFYCNQLLTRNLRKFQPTQFLHQ